MDGKVIKLLSHRASAPSDGPFVLGANPPEATKIKIKICKFISRMLSENNKS